MALEQFLQNLKTPIGWLHIHATSDAIWKVSFSEDQIGEESQNKITRDAHDQLEAYFNGDLKQFDLPLNLQGTEFQKKVWKELELLPYGTTCSYGDIAEKLKDKAAVRAVGSANGQNPIAIIIPCHRVIGANGSLTGYAGGLHRKKWLLNFESPVKQGALFE